MKSNAVKVMVLVAVMLVTVFMTACGPAEETARDNTDKATKADEGTKVAQEYSQQQEDDSQGKTENKPEASTTAPEPAKVCYVTVEGYCSSKQITLKGGESVYDVLIASGAGVSARNSGYGIYVEGINGRFEFDEGPSSGWVYYVNGSKPNISCNEYSVKAGDSVVWSYTTEL